MNQIIPKDTRNRQHNASDPTRSVWVSANAGSGKTHVLVQRVLRLLLEGVAPSRILCLTFTKAAATNMSARVFKTLADWTRLDDQALSTAIVETGAARPGFDTLLIARRLFARTVETPGGLKIQTIHAFCERLLHLFPFEANVPAHFQVLEDLQQATLLEQARVEILAHASELTELGEAIDFLAGEASVTVLNDVIRQALDQLARFRHVPNAELERRLLKLLLLKAHETPEAIARDMIEGGLSPTRWSEIALVLEQGTANDKKLALAFRQVDAAYRAYETDLCVELLQDIYLTGKGEARKLMTKNLGLAHPGILATLEAAQLHFIALLEKRKAAFIVKRTNALLAIARAIAQRYESMKTVRGFLDFADLIEKTSTLLTRSDARWVLYKLDQGIDHILVDEAQDTSEAQWNILRELIGDFAVGASAVMKKRTFFAVGDEKQSIFSFQGAAPDMFEEMSQILKKKLTAGGEAFSHVKLNMSFRSVPAILNTVDQLFASPMNKKGVTRDKESMVHVALKDNLPGLVEIWPVKGQEAEEKPIDWRLPLDALDDEAPASIIAKRIADRIAKFIAPQSKDRVTDNKTRHPRAIRAQDILILVRTRGPFFEAVIRALKQAGVPVAGADRLELTGHIAVMDLVAVGRIALLPEDDLSLACVLKSPLIGLDDDDLLEFAPKRRGSLFEALQASTKDTHQKAYEKILHWHQRAKGALPFAFYMQLLSEDGGRRDMEARLGPEARDAMDEFLRLALAHEQETAPSLARFLAGLEGVDLPVKRDMEHGLDAVRVMTVHASKGLEAKIVFLPDTCGLPSSQHDPKLFLVGDSLQKTVAWSRKKADDCAITAAARTIMRERAEEEYRRLLYVALTRAEERLYIGGFFDKRAPHESCWYEMIHRTFADKFEEVPAFWDETETLLRFSTEKPDLFAFVPDEVQQQKTQEPARPDWVTSPAPHEAVAKPPLRPSSALAAADLFEPASLPPAQREAMRRGRLMHVLLQYLPDVATEQRLTIGDSFLLARASDLGDDIRHNLVADAAAIIGQPELAPLFGQNGAKSRAEVPIAGRVTLPTGASVAVSGQVDRISETEGEVWIADFKTGKPPADQTPEAYIVQMALYRAALAPLWPQKQLKMMLIWTQGPKITTLDSAELTAALSRI